MNLLTVLLISLVGAEAQGPVLGIDGTRFTLDGTPRFLLGCSYYGALGMDDPGAIEEDLRGLGELGFNWIRVWVTWDFDENNVSAVTAEGAVRPLYMERLKQLCRLAGKHGFVVDVTVSRGKDPFPATQPPHLAAMRTLAEELKPWRNVYFDVGNERDVRDARYVSSEEVGELITAVKAIDPERICTASSVPRPDNIEKFLSVAKMDFVAPHLARHPKAPKQTAGQVRALLEAMQGASRTVPVLLQEPFRRGYQDNWQPVAEDFMTDLKGALDGGAAGWCFHNGATRGTADQRPRRSFDMRPREGSLIGQLDEEEGHFLEELRVLQPRLAAWPGETR